MDRAALGLGSVFLHLRAAVNWYELFNKAIEGFDVNILAARQEQLLIKHNLVAAAAENQSAA
jgi:hypothetical protein